MNINPKGQPMTTQLLTTTGPEAAEWAADVIDRLETYATGLPRLIADRDLAQVDYIVSEMRDIIRMVAQCKNVEIYSSHPYHNYKLRLDECVRTPYTVGLETAYNAKIDAQRNPNQ
jgi:hypothetical protein